MAKIVTKMGSKIGQEIDYNGVGELPWVPETFLARFPVSVKSL